MKTSRLVISFTCLPSRINNIPIILNSISEQTLIPDLVVLHVPNKCIRLNQSYDTATIYEMIDKSPLREKIIVNSCKDYGPITKIYPLVDMPQIMQDDTIIVIDDDHCYNPYLFEALVADFAYHKNQSCVCISGLLYPRQLDSKYMCYHNGMQTELMEAAFGYILQRSFLQNDFEKWVLHSVNSVSDIHANKWDNAFVSDDYVVSRYLDTRNILKFVIRNNLFVTKPSCFIADSECVTEDSLCSLGLNLDKYVKTEIELKIKRLV